MLTLEISKKTLVSQITIREAWTLYEPATRNNRSSKDDCGRAKKLLFHIGEVKLGELTLNDVERYRAARLKEPTQRGAQPSPTTLNHEVKLLRRIVNHQIKTGKLEQNPLTGLKLLREDNVRDTVIDEARFEQLLAAACVNLRPLIIMAYDTGMRREEILGLRWSNVDLKSGAVFLPKTKNGHARTVLLSGRARDTLSGLPHSTSGYVFVNPKTNRPWTDIKKMWHKARRTAGLEGVWFHDLRRSFVTNARRRGVQESVVMKLSGHRTRAVFDRYNIVSTDDLQEAMKKIEVGRQEELHGQDDNRQLGLGI